MPFSLRQGKFVAAFAQSNCGDVSPNINGPRCIDTGLPCDLATSTCDGRVQKCIASGPGKDMVESTKIIGERQFTKAWVTKIEEGGLLLEENVMTMSTEVRRMLTVTATAFSF